MLDAAEGLRARGHSCLLAGPARRPWLTRTRELGWPAIELSIRGDFAPGISIRLRRLFHRESIDVVVCNFEQDVRVAGMARLAGRRPAIVNLKGLPLISDTLRHRLVHRYFLDQTIVCAKFMRD